MSAARRRVASACAVSAMVMALGPTVQPAVAFAATPPLSSNHLATTVQDRPVRVFLSDLLAPSGIAVVIAPDVGGNVSGAFEGATGDIYRKIATAFGLRSYYDGRKLFIYTATDVRSGEFGGSRAEAERAAAAVRRAGLMDTDDTVAVVGDHLVATGAARFVDQVAELLQTKTVVGSPARRVVASVRLPASDDAAPEYRVFRLQYAWAGDMQMNSGGKSIAVPGVATILRKLVAEQEASSVSVTPSAAEPDASNGVSRASDRHADVVGRDNSLGAGLADLFGLARAAADKPAEARPPLPPPAPATVQVRLREALPRIEADPRLNAVIVRDTPARLAQYEALIQALDSEPRIVEIEAAIIDVDVERLGESGLSFDVRGSDGNEISLNPVAPGTVGKPGQGLFITAAIGSRDRFTASLQALETKGIARVTAHPLIVTLSDVEAAFQNNQTFFVPVAGSLSTELYNVAAGTMLKVTPHVSVDGGGERIRLLVDIEDGAIGGQQIGALPVVEKSGINTESIVLNGQSLLVGGMVVESSDTSGSKIPVLGDLPVAGRLFRASHKDVRHVERLFLITPHLAAPGATIAPPIGAGPMSPEGSSSSTQPEGAR